MSGLVSKIETKYLIMFLTECLLTIKTEAYRNYVLFFTNITVYLMRIQIRPAVFNCRGVVFHSLPVSTIYLPKTQNSLHTLRMQSHTTKSIRDRTSLTAI